MTYQRWATLSVKDHLDLRGLIADVLLYDRLVIPVPPENDEKELKRWHDWNPELLNERVKLLNKKESVDKKSDKEIPEEISDDIVIKIPWDANKRERYKERMSLSPDVKIEAFQTTRDILARDMNFLHLGDNLDVVTAYHSENDVKSDFPMEANETHDISKTGLIFGQMIVVPDEEREEVLEEAAKLSRNSDFQRLRRKLYEKQDEMIKDRRTNEQVLDKLNDLTNEYNEMVKDRFHKNVKKLIATIATIGLSAVAAHFAASPEVIGGAAISSFTYYAIDRQDVGKQDKFEPIAMFQESKEKLSRKHFYRKFLDRIV